LSATRPLWRRILRNLRPARARRIIAHPRFAWLTYRTNGMLWPDVYAEVHRRLIAVPDLPFVEVGAASGTGTIAMAWAYSKAGHQAKIVAVEKCEGGSRDRFGDFDDNLATLNDNLARYGCSQHVRLFTDRLSLDSRDTLLQAIGGSTISGFMHDADGRLDRDFDLLWPLTIDGGLIIVDDCLARAELGELLAEKGSSGRKFFMTAAGWKVIVAAGLVEQATRIDSTVFAVKPAGSGLTVPTEEIRSAIDQAAQDYDQALADRSDACV